MSNDTQAGPRPGKRIRVLIVDDSALIRQLLTQMLSEQPDIEVVGAAGDPYIARQKIKQLEPDVLTLDVEMPRMDGITFLRNLMRLHPMPVVMVSSLTEKGADVTLDALELGVIDFVTKPRVDMREGMALLAREIQEKVRAAAGAQIQTRLALTPRPARVGAVKHLRTTDRLLALGASTGGTEAVKEVLCALPPDAPGVVIVQHIPPSFSAAFARRVDSLAAITVKEAEHGEAVLPGHAYVAPGDKHLRIRRSGGRYVCELGSDAPVNRHRPSVDALFHSLAESAGPNATAALLTGMGSDGARGLLALKSSGAHTFAQDRASSVVWGMPGEAVRLGAAEAVLPLDQLPSALLARAVEEGRAEPGSRRAG